MENYNIHDTPRMQLTLSLTIALVLFFFGTWRVIYKYRRGI